MWFPSVHAEGNAIRRDDLDEPIGLLMKSGLIRVRDWVRGRGQGYELTPEGRTVLEQGSEVIAKTALTRQTPPPPPEPRVPRGLTTYDRGEIARSALLGPRALVCVPTLLAVNLGVFLLGGVLARHAGVDLEDYLRRADSPESAGILSQLGAASGQLLARGEWWRLFSYMFVHIGGMHLFMNMMTLVVIGPTAEQWWGRKRFLAIYFVSGLAGGCAAMAFQPMSMTAGASGALWGVMASLLVWLLRYRRHLPPAIFRSFFRLLVLGLVINTGISFVPGISWPAHFAGGIFGGLTAYIVDVVRSGAGRKRILLGSLAFAAMLASIAGSFALAVKESRRWRVMLEAPKAEEFIEFAGDLFSTGLMPTNINKFLGDIALTYAVQSPTKTRACRDEFGRLRGGLVSLRAKWDGKHDIFTNYLDQVEHFLDLATPMLEFKKNPSKEEWKAIGLVRDGLMANEIIILPAPPRRLEPRSHPDN